MRILVLSDSHGHGNGLINAIEQQPLARTVFFLGDGLREAEDLEYMYSDRNFFFVKGNCDYAASAPYKRLEIIGGKRIYFTHGFAENVKFGTEMLMQDARSQKANIVLYGHTHTPYTGYSDGIYILNPGSVRDENYGIIDITPAGIVCVNMKIR